MTTTAVKQDNSQALSRSAQRVQDALRAQNIACKVIELPDSARTAQAAADALACSVDQIVKSLIFRTKESQRPILILASGSNRVNEKAIAKHLGEKIERADADFTRKVTGYAIGGIPPMGHVTDIPTLIDEDLYQYDVLWAAAGTPHAVFSFTPADLHPLTQGTILSIK